MSPFYKNTGTRFIPLLEYASLALAGLVFPVVLWVLTLGCLFLTPENELRGGEKYKLLIWGSEDIEASTAAGGSLMHLYGLDEAGSAKLKLAKDVYAADQHTVSTKGDLVELGYFSNKISAGSGQYAPSATSGDLFLGKYWVPLTNTSRIGQRSYDDSASPAENLDGISMIQTKFTDNNTPTPAVYNTVTHNPDQGNWEEEDTVADLQLKLDALDTLDGTGDAFLAIRFYDVDTATGTFATVGGNQADLASATKQSRYNTITSSEFKWVARADTGPFENYNMSLHDDDGTLRALEYEMDNTSGGSYASVEIGTGGSNTVGAIGDSATVRTATITLRDGTALDLANIGDTIVSNLSDDVSTANIAGHASNEADLTVLARSTSTTYTYSGVISNKVDIHKIGAGTQELTGAVNTTGVLSIDEGPLTLKPGSNLTQSFEYLTDDGTPGTLSIDNTNGAAHVVELGFATTTVAQTFTGAITLSDSGTNTLKVGGVTATDFDDHQILSGNIGDDGSGATLKKTGSGKLTLSGSGSNFTGGVTIADGGGAVDGGIVVAGHANALGTGTTTIEHGKLSVAGGITVANTIAGQGTNDNTDMKSVIGGGVGNSVGTITNGGSILNIGSGNGEVDVVSPGIAHASSMTNGTSDYQVIAGNKDDSDPAAVDVTNSIGTMKITNLGLKAGGVFDWEIRDFEGGNGAGADWDVLQFDSLTLGAKSDRFAINIYGVAPDGSAGKQDFSVSAAGSKNLLNKTGSFAFLTGGTVSWTGGSQWSDTEINDYFVINADAFHSSNSYWGNGGWGVSYSGGNFILGYSAVPEPSTYVMVTGLLMLPGFQFLRRFRRRKNKGE
jgi:autotransporter-associated beta strand protein